MSVVIERETQRLIIAMTLLIGFFVSFLIVFALTRDVEIGKTVLTFLAGAITSVVSFFFGVKTAEKMVPR